MSKTKKGVSGIVFLTVFLDIVGFSIIFPLFPGLLEYYLDISGNDSMLGALNRELQQFAGGDANAVVTLFGGLLGSVYGLLQFIFSTVWGGLSDRIGRRPTLIVTLVGTALAHLLWVFAGTFGVLVLARVLGGIMAGNISTASAVIADSTEGKQRSAGMAIVGMAIGLGFILGPAIGALLMSIDLTRFSSSGALSLNKYSGAALGALALSVINLVWVVVRLEETLPIESRSTEATGRSFNPIRRLVSINLPGVSRTNLVFLIYLTAFAGAEFTLTFLAVERFNYDEMDIAKLFVFIGLIIAGVQGGIVRRVGPIFGERRVAIVGIATTSPGFALTGLATHEGLLYLGCGLMAVGSALIHPSLSALVSRYVPSSDQGIALGAFRSMGSLSRAVGPIIGAFLYYYFGSASPFIAGAILLLMPFFMAFALPPPSDSMKAA